MQQVVTTGRLWTVDTTAQATRDRDRNRTDRGAQRASVECGRPGRGNNNQTTKLYTVQNGISATKQDIPVCVSDTATTPPNQTSKQTGKEN